MSSGPSNIDPSMQPPMMPNIPSQAAPAPTNPISSGSGSSGGGFSSFQSFLGPQGYQQFITILCTMISTQIGQEMIQNRKASQTLKDSFTDNG